MKQKGNQTDKNYRLILVAAICLAVAALVLTKGKLDISMAGKTLSRPTDTPLNLEYGLSYHPSSRNILKRDGIILKNFGAEIKAQDLSSGACLDVSSITARSSQPILQISEYVGYLYMYDGETVYRTNVDGSYLKSAIKDCLKFEPMGNYLYSLKMHRGNKHLFRCSITGTYEKMLFKENVLDFWAYGGHLLLLSEDRTYHYYNVLTQNTFTHTLPEDAGCISLDDEGILFLSSAGTSGAPLLYRRPFLSGQDTPLSALPVACYSAAEGNIALIFSSAEKGGWTAAWCASDESSMHTMTEKAFSPNCSLDISSSHLFVTVEDGTTWYTPLSHEDWNILF